MAALEKFVSTRAAFVAQKTLYGYVKTRMGTRYVAMFEDKAMVASLNIAKMHVFAACLSDLSIYAVATAAYGHAVPNDSSRELARRCYAAGLRDNSADAPAEFSAQECIDEFDRRLSETDWQHGARQPENFTQSPASLVRWAPIADKLKKFDSEIIENRSNSLGVTSASNSTSGSMRPRSPPTGRASRPDRKTRRRRYLFK